MTHSPIPRCVNFCSAVG